MTTLQNLDALIDLLGDESSWTRNAYARDRTGEVTQINSEDAVSFCLTGGIWKVTRGNGGTYTSLLSVLRRAIGGTSLVSFNDHRKYEDVVNLLKETRNRLEKEAAE